MPEHTRTKLAIWIVQHLPKRVMYWAAVHVAIHATLFTKSNADFRTLSALEAYDRFGKDFNVQ